MKSDLIYTFFKCKQSKSQLIGVVDEVLKSSGTITDLKPTYLKTSRGCWGVSGLDHYVLFLSFGFVNVDFWTRIMHPELLVTCKNSYICTDCAVLFCYLIQIRIYNGLEESKES